MTDSKLVGLVGAEGKKGMKQKEHVPGSTGTRIGRQQELQALQSGAGIRDSGTVWWYRQGEMAGDAGTAGGQASGEEASGTRYWGTQGWGIREAARGTSCGEGRGKGQAAYCCLPIIAIYLLYL